jgi:hypothetical protein
MRINNEGKEINVSSYAGVGKTLQVAIDDALEDYTPQDNVEIYVVFIRIVSQDRGNIWQKQNLQ